jgi:cytochrome c
MRTLAVITTGLLLAGAARATPEETATPSAGMASHAKDKKLVGPVFMDVAAKYKGQTDAGAQRAPKVRASGQGVWGPIPMSPNPPERIADGDLQAVLDWVFTP